ncbi:MAG: HU-CCDC81 and SPOR domain-containing protein [Flavobacteriia bacterium]|nr:HU-CCDC81 and SPOR domain-containing protein [Flavobacteriia bacterium]
MITVEELIGNLLLRNNCVIVPSFGGFVANQTSATIDYANGVMFPPKKSVLFNRQLINNDGLLIKEYSAANTISYTDADIYLKTKVLEWNEKLANGERVTLDRVGYIFLDTEKNICFEQDRFFNLLLESYGLGKVHFIAEEDVQLVQHIHHEKPFIAVEEKPLFDLESSNINSISPINEEKELVEIQHPAVKKKSSVWKYVAAAVFLPIAFYSYWIPMKTNVLESGILSFNDFNPNYQIAEGKYKQENLTLINIDQEKELSLEKSIEKYASNANTYPLKFNDDIYIIVRLKEKSVENSNEVLQKEIELLKIEKPKIIPTVVTKGVVKKSFDLVVGCFSTEANAKSLVNTLVAKGLSAKIVDKNGELFRVSAGTAYSNDEILKVKEQAKAFGVDGWILKK